MEQVAAGFTLFAQWDAILAMTIGTVLGIVVGAIPGIGPAQLIPLTLPFTFGMEPVPALLLLLGEFIGGMYGGSITAILVNTPGTPASVATTFDGYPLARQGKAGKALKMALYASVCGDIVATALLVFLAERLARFALMFGPAEIAAVILLSMTLVVAVAGRSLTKGFVSAVIGGLLAIIGTDSITGTPRLVFGMPALHSGVGIVPLIMGIFAVSEVMLLAERRFGRGNEHIADLHGARPEDRRLSFQEFWSARGAMLRGTFVGIGVGTVPGLGASIASMLSYGFARRRSKSPEQFGHGSLEGVAAPEAANNAETSGALLPFLVLGIPGSALVAMLGGAFLLHGLDPGPFLFTVHGDKMYAIYMGMFATKAVMLAVGLGGMNLFHYIVRVPRDILFSAVLVMSVAGVFAISASLADVWMMLAFGAMGYAMRRMGVPTAPLLIAFILVPLLEHSLRQALLISGGSFMIFVKSPIAAAFIGATVLWLVVRLARLRPRRTTPID